MSGVSGSMIETSWREETAADRLEKVIEEVRKERERSGRTEKINFKILVGINNTLYD